MSDMPLLRVIDIGKSFTERRGLFRKETVCASLTSVFRSIRVKPWHWLVKRVQARAPWPRSWPVW